MEGLYLVLTLAVLASAPVSGFELSFLDPEACVTIFEGTSSNLTRVLEATPAVAVTTPGYNNSDPVAVYPPNQVCQWQLFTNDLVSVFSLGIVDMDVDCVGDYIDVFDGPDDTAPLLGSHCGRVGAEHTSSSGSFFVRFVSDGISPGGGAGIRAGPPVLTSGCDPSGELINTEGRFSSPNYPLPYPNDLNCRFDIEAPVGMNVELSFEGFDLAEICSRDVLELQGMDGSFGVLIARYARDMWPPVVTSVGNRFRVEFHSDATTVAQGFLANVRFVPDTLKA